MFDKIVTLLKTLFSFIEKILLSWLVSSRSKYKEKSTSLQRILNNVLKAKNIRAACRRNPKRCADKLRNRKKHNNK